MTNKVRNLSYGIVAAVHSHIGQRGVSTLLFGHKRSAKSLDLLFRGGFHFFGLLGGLFDGSNVHERLLR